MSSMDEGSTAEEEKFVKCLLENDNRKELVVLPKSSVLEAVEAVLNRKKLDGHVRQKSLCSDRLHLPIYEKRLTYRKNRNNCLPIFSEMRHCLLTGDWDGYKELLLMFIKSPKVPMRHTLYCVRSSFVLLFNHPNRTAEMVDTFIATCLHVTEESQKAPYLRDCFAMRSGTADGNKSGDSEEQEQEEKEEEVFFNSEYSSD